MAFTEGAACFTLVRGFGKEGCPERPAGPRTDSPHAPRRTGHIIAGTTRHLRCSVGRRLRGPLRGMSGAFSAWPGSQDRRFHGV